VNHLLSPGFGRDLGVVDVITDQDDQIIVTWQVVCLSQALLGLCVCACDWGLNSGLHACKAGAVQLESLL
jgi:hypothetical protein